MDQIERLRSIGCKGFEDDGQVNDLGQLLLPVPWETNFEKLKAYKKRFGVDPTQNNPELWEDAKLGRWLGTQRWSFRQGTLDPSKLEKLRDLQCKGFR